MKRMIEHDPNTNLDSLVVDTQASELLSFRSSKRNFPSLDSEDIKSSSYNFFDISVNVESSRTTAVLNYYR